MGDQEVLAERLPAGADHAVGGQPAQLGEPGRSLQGQRHQRRCGLDHRGTELAGDAVAAVAGAGRRQRQPAGGDDQAWGGEIAERGRDHEGVLMDDRVDAAGGRDLHPGGGAFAHKEGDDDLPGAARRRTRLRPRLLLMVGDAMALDLAQEVLGAEARQRRGAEVRVGREVVLRAGVQVGEVAAAAAGDQDLAAQALGVVEHRDPPAPPTGGDGAPQPGRPTANDQRVRRSSPAATDGRQEGRTGGGRRAMAVGRSSAVNAPGKAGRPAHPATACPAPG